MIQGPAKVTFCLDLICVDGFFPISGNRPFVSVFENIVTWKKKKRKHCYLKCNLWASSISTTWDLLEMQNLSQKLVHWTKNLHFKKNPQVICGHFQFWKHSQVLRPFFLNFNYWYFNLVTFLPYLYFLFSFLSMFLREPHPITYV